MKFLPNFLRPYETAIRYSLTTIIPACAISSTLVLAHHYIIKPDYSNLMDPITLLTKDDMVTREEVINYVLGAIKTRHIQAIRDAFTSVALCAVGPIYVSLQQPTRAVLLNTIALCLLLGNVIDLGKTLREQGLAACHNLLPLENCMFVEGSSLEYCEFFATTRDLEWAKECWDMLSKSMITYNGIAVKYSVATMCTLFTPSLVDKATHYINRVWNRLSEYDIIPG